MAKGRRRQVSQEGAETSCRSRVGIPETTPPPTIHYIKDSRRIQGGKTLVDTGVFAPRHGDASDQGLPWCRSGASLWACELAGDPGCTQSIIPGSPRNSARVRINRTGKRSVFRSQHIRSTRKRDERVGKWTEND